MSGERIDYGFERQRHAGFVGRGTLLARLDQLLIADPPIGDQDQIDRCVVVTGEPGMGKSALLATWLAQREAAGVAIPHHFLRRGVYDWDDPAKLVSSLVAQLEDQFPDQREPTMDAQMHPPARLAAMLARVSARQLVPRGKRLVVLIDGLDEYDPPAGVPTGDPLAAFLPHRLPRGVSLLCASRPRHGDLAMLEARGGELVRIDLDDPAATADNDATVRGFWEHAAPPLGLGTPFIEEAVAGAGGNLQHAVTLRKHLAAMPEAQRRHERIPRGLAALLATLWERLHGDPIAVGGLGILCAAREALTLDELGAVAGWGDDAQGAAFLRGASAVIVETRRAGDQAEYQLHHDAIREDVASRLGPATLRGHHAALARQLATWPPPGEANARRYALRHALTHRAAAGDWAEAWRFVSDMNFLEAKCRELGVHEAEADVARMAERCRAGGHEAIGRRFDDLARALARESQWLRAAPAVTAGLVWNRLRRTAGKTDERPQVPVEVAFLRVRHGTPRERGVPMRGLAGHAGWVNACAVTRDGRRTVSASDDQTLKVWDVDSGQLLATLAGHALHVTSCAVAPDGRRVVSASLDETLKVWDLDRGQLLATFEGHAGAVTACAVTPDGRRVVSASWDLTLSVWDLDRGERLHTFDMVFEDHACELTVTPDSRRVVSASENGMLKLLHLDDGSLLTTFRGHTGAVTACAVTPDGQRVVSASRDQTLKVWDLASGLALATFTGHTGAVTACAVTPDGRQVVSASQDQTLKVWDLDTYACLLTHHGDAPYTAVATTAATVVAGDDCGTVWFLDCPLSIHPVAPPSRSSPQRRRPV